MGFLLIEKLATQIFGEYEYALSFFPLLSGLAALILFYFISRKYLQMRKRNAFPMPGLGEENELMRSYLDQLGEQIDLDQLGEQIDFFEHRGVFVLDRFSRL